MIDAFSGDSVPVHLLTREAFEVYLRHLKPGGVIAVHITNHYLNLAPVVERVAKEFKLGSTRIGDQPPEEDPCYLSDYVLLTTDKAFLQAHPPEVPDYATEVQVPLWTDHRSNLFQILHHR